MLTQVRIPGDGYRRTELTVPVVVIWYPSDWPAAVGLGSLEAAFATLGSLDGPKAIYTNTTVPDWGRAGCRARGITLLEGPLKNRCEPDTAAVTAAVRRLFA